MDTMEMKTSGKSNDWKYLVDDYLEIKTRLTENQRREILREIEKIKPHGINNIGICQTLMIDGQMMITISHLVPETCLFYYESTKRFEKLSMR